MGDMHYYPPGAFPPFTLLVAFNGYPRLLPTPKGAGEQGAALLYSPRVTNTHHGQAPQKWIDGYILVFPGRRGPDCLGLVCVVVLLYLRCLPYRHFLEVSRL